VANEIIIIETSYKNLFEKIITVLDDTLANLQIKANWDSYRTDREWRDLFKSKDFRIVDSRYYRDYNIGIPFLHILYFLKKI